MVAPKIRSSSKTYGHPVPVTGSIKVENLVLFLMSITTLLEVRNEYSVR